MIQIIKHLDNRGGKVSAEGVGSPITNEIWRVSEDGAPMEKVGAVQDGKATTLLLDLDELKTVVEYMERTP